MDVRLSDEQGMLRETAARIAGAAPPPAILAPTDAEVGPDVDAVGAENLWTTLGDAGLLNLLVPEDAGGMGATVVDAALVAVELGAALAPVPFLEQAVLAPWLLHRGGASEPVDPAMSRLAPALVPDLDVFAGPDRAEVLVDARADEVLTIDGNGTLRRHGIRSPRPVDQLDLTRPRRMASLEEGREVGCLDQDDRTRLDALALTIIAADLVGVMRAAVTETVAYVTDRTQFGRPVGSFQALQHLLADAAVLVDASTSSLLHAAWAVDALDPTPALLAARQAKAYVTGAARTAIEIAVQGHGGIAITWEHPMHLRLRRALVGGELLGDRRTQELAIAEMRLDRDPPDDRVPPATGRPGIDFGDLPDEATFRADLRRWLAEQPAPEPGDGPDAEMEAQFAWHRRLADAGFVGLSFPTDYGGRGLSPLYDAILNDELGAAGAPPAPAINHITNAIRLFGTEEQKREHLPGMLSCRVRWCQGFSEPNAGSDLAAVATRGERGVDPSGEDFYTVSGQKIWTSEALWASWCLLLLRTEPDRPRHRGLSMLLVPMDTPGIEVRPIVTAYGSREFAEVFFADVRVPAANLLGEPGQGWSIAMSLLGFERGPSDMGWTARLGRQITRVEAAIRSGEIDADLSQRRALAAAWAELEALRVHVQRSTSHRLDGSAPGPEGSIDKLLMTSVDQHVSHVLADLLGSRSVVDAGDHFTTYVWSRSQSIFGGTQQIQRDIVAQHVLGLPAEP